MNKKGFDKKEKGRVIDNQPGWDGVCTGRYETDYHGCWWEVKKDNGDKCWMIGEYPSSCATEEKVNGVAIGG